MKPITVNRFLSVWALIATVICIILFNVKSCGGISTQVTYKTDTVITVIHDTIEKVVEVPKYVPKIIRITEPPIEVIDSLPVNDSAYCKELAIDHYTKKEYRDTVGNDSVKLDLTMYVSKNNVDSVKPKVILNIPYVQTVYQVIKTPIPKNPIKVYIGGELGTNGLGFVGGPEITLTDRNLMMYKLGVDFSTFTTPVYRVGVSVKISFRKK